MILGPIPPRSLPAKKWPPVEQVAGVSGRGFAAPASEGRLALPGCAEVLRPEYRVGGTVAAGDHAGDGGRGAGRRLDQDLALAEAAFADSRRLFADVAIEMQNPVVINASGSPRSPWRAIGFYACDA